MNAPSSRAPDFTSATISRIGLMSMSSPPQTLRSMACTRRISSTLVSSRNSTAAAGGSDDEGEGAAGDVIGKA